MIAKLKFFASILQSSVSQDASKIIIADLVFNVLLLSMLKLGVDRYVFFRADADTDYYRSSRPITDILNRYTYLV